MKIKQIFENNEKWIELKVSSDPEYFKKLSKGQCPEILYIGCSDSRVTAEELMGATPGDVFVHRNIGNMVPNADMSALSVINYAVLRLHVKHIVVCGHYYCGGVKAAMETDDLGVLNPWLKNIRDVNYLHRDELNQIKDEKQKYHRLVELNVREQCINLIKIAAVQKAYHERKLKVHGWVFDTESGKLIDLEIDFEKLFKDILKVYDISG